jgi:malate dehydrogenase (oxaloacetate-decarboxylating)(NADP+)
LTSYPSLAHHRFLFFGAGDAGIGIADLLVAAIVKEYAELQKKELSAGKEDHVHRSFPNLTIDCRQYCWFIDSKGLITSDRLAHGEHVNPNKLRYAHDKAALPPPTAEDISIEAHLKENHLLKSEGLLEAVRLVKPTVLIGVSTQEGAFTEEVIKEMLKYSRHPIVLASSNPTDKSECTASQAYHWSDGKVVFASGSPFPPVTLGEGQCRIPGQCNNAYIFPAMGLAAISAKVSHITDDDFLVAAEALASQVTSSQLETGCIYPDISHMREISLLVAAHIATHMNRTGRSEYCTKEKVIDWYKHCASNMYTPSYPDYKP